MHVKDELIVIQRVRIFMIYLVLHK